MRLILLLCTSLCFANELCKIKTTTSFNNHQRYDLEVFLTNPQNDFDNVRVGSLFSLFMIQQLDFVEPNSIIYHNYMIQSSEGPETYEIKEEIELKGCSIESIRVASNNAEAQCSHNTSSAFISYQLVNKTNAKPPEEDLEDLI